MSTVTSPTPIWPAMSASFENVSAEEIVRWAVETFGARSASRHRWPTRCSSTSPPNAHPSIEVVFLDTQYHFPETLATVWRVEQRYQLKLRVLTPDREPDELWRTDTDACCEARKVEPLARHMASRAAWMTGCVAPRAKPGATRAIVERDARGLGEDQPARHLDRRTGRRLHPRARRPRTRCSSRATRRSAAGRAPSG